MDREFPHNAPRTDEIFRKASSSPALRPPTRRPPGFSGKHAAGRLLLNAVALAFVLLLAACGGTGSTGSTSTPTPKPPTPTPTVALHTYTGQGFTFRYPAAWTATGSSPVMITDSTGAYTVNIGSVANPGGLLSPDKLAESGLKGGENSMHNVQSTNMPATVTIGGQAWSQRAAVGISTDNGQSVSIELVVLATNRPANSANTKGYIIVYGTLQSLFQQASQMYFTPMLQSFAFTS